ncbi:MAG: hypothetical protein Q4G58_08265 [bacterium]|nr:hypothetical protein [bacterium]
MRKILNIELLIEGECIPMYSPSIDILEVVRGEECEKTGEFQKGKCKLSELCKKYKK